MAEVVFETRGLTKTYNTGEVQVQALRGVDVRLYASELAVLLGASGSGKSTLLNILGGLDRASGGMVLFRGEDITHADESALTDFRRRNVGFVFQFYNLMPSLTARENVALVTHIAADPMTPEAALELVGLGNRMDHFPAELSGGEQQRVAIARALLNDPELILADEPTGNLDPQTSFEVMEVLRDLNKKGQTFLMATHDYAILSRYPSRTLKCDNHSVFEVVQRQS